MISNSADIDYVDEYNDSILSFSMRNKNFYSIIYLLFNGASLTQQVQEKVMKENEKNKIEEKEMIQKLISDYFENKLWNVQRNKYFPSSFKNILFSFLVSIKIFSTQFQMKIPKPIQYLIIQDYVSQQIQTNILKRKKTK